MKIRKLGDEVLHTKCEKITVFDNELKTLEEEMYKAMRKADGIGLAGPQVGVTKRIFVIEIPSESVMQTFVNPEIIESQWTKDLSFFQDVRNMQGLDLVVAVPVCAGLSSATRASQETCDARNCNMIWIAKYVLNVLRPQCYIFENAPRLMSNAGDRVRKQCEQIAIDAGYSIVYYRTDTMLHDNAQKRSRTFVLFFRGEHAPRLEYENAQVDILDYLKRIPADATQQECIEWLPFNNDFVKYATEKLGDDAFSKFNVVTKWIAYNDLYDDFKAWLKKHPEHHPSTEKFIDHVFDKMSQGGGWYDMSCYRSHDNKTHAVIFKTMKSELHPVENRLFTIREQLHLMTRNLRYLEQKLFCIIVLHTYYVYKSQMIECLGPTLRIVASQC